MLRVESVSYSTPPPRNLKILDNLSFTAREKEHSIIYGDNGSGKSTIVRLLIGIIRENSGNIVRSDKGIVAVFEDIETQLLFSTVKEELRGAGDDFLKDDIVNILGINKLKDRSTLELSYSQKARVVFAASYLTGKEYMLLDSLPPDHRLDKAISTIAERNLRSLILFAPFGRIKSFSGEWKSYLLEKSGLRRYNGN